MVGVGGGVKTERKSRQDAKVFFYSKPTSVQPGVLPGWWIGKLSKGVSRLQKYLLLSKRIDQIYIRNFAPLCDLSIPKIIFRAFESLVRFVNRVSMIHELIVQDGPSRYRKDWEYLLFTTFRACAHVYTHGCSRLVHRLHPRHWIVVVLFFINLVCKTLQIPRAASSPLDRAHHITQPLRVFKSLGVNHEIFFPAPCSRAS